MPISGARASFIWNGSFSAPTPSWVGSWSKIAGGVYILAMIPYLLMGIIKANWWQAGKNTVAWLDFTGALMFMLNSLFDFSLAIHFSRGKTCCHGMVIDDDSPIPWWAEQWPKMEMQLQTANCFLVGSIFYIICTIPYFAGTVAHYWGGCGYKEVDITALVVYVVHAMVCIIGTLIGNKDLGAPKKYLVCCGCKRWQDLDWYLWGDITFMAAAIFEVTLNFYLKETGGFKGSLGWIVNAFIYTAVAFAEDALRGDDNQPANHLTASLLSDAAKTSVAASTELGRETLDLPDAEKGLASV